MSQGDGKGGVVRELVTAARAEFEDQRRGAEGAQITMFPVPTRFHGPRADAVQRSTERRAEAGRPPGAQNATTKEFREWLLLRGVSPLVSLMRYAIMPPDLLAAELACTKLEAFREWRILQSELAPYLHARLALVDDQGKAVPSIMMTVGGHQVTVANGMTPWELREQLAAQVAQGNQAVIDAPPAVSHDAVSHGEGK